MNTNPLRFRSRLLAALVFASLLFAFSPKSHAAPAPAALLSDAYHQLEVADHDYKGHRAAAMKQIAAAGKLLGVKIGGKAKDHEKQGVSDEHLRNALGLLQEAAPGLTGKPLAHVDAAEKQIQTALKIK